jgi:hypothetical protein
VHSATGEPEYQLSRFKSIGVEHGLYDPDASPLWIGSIPTKRTVELVSDYHRHRKIALPNLQLHAVVHVVVENQIALGDEMVVKTLARLRGEGLTRHDAIHAIGSVLAENLFELMQDDDRVTGALYQRYLERLQRLTAENWRAG